MDFAWVVGALRHGFRVTRKVWAGEPLYIELTAPDSNSIIAVGSDTQVENWLCLNSDIFADDWEEYVEPKKELVFGDTPTLQFIRETTGSSGVLGDIVPEQDSHGGTPVKESDLDEETNKAISLVARNIAEDLVELLQNPSVQRILQMRDVPLSKGDANHEKED